MYTKRNNFCMYVTRGGAVHGFGHAGWGQLGLDEDDASFRSEVDARAIIVNKHTIYNLNSKP